MKELVRGLCPPILWRALQRLNAGLPRPGAGTVAPGSQDLDVYWDPRIVEALEQWGEGTAWNEIKLLLVNARGKVLDIACGTGKVMSLLADFKQIEVHGCDISDMLIGKAIDRGIARERLIVTDATAMRYGDGIFDYAYSIGSLEHFTEDGIGKFLHECARVVAGPSFHMVPVSRSGRDEGWISPFQSYHNNSVGWWEERCKTVFPRVVVLDSAWSDTISVGKWLVCGKAT